MEEQLPKTVGRYEIIELAGSGASGNVYKAYDPILKRTVAIKMPVGGMEGKQLDVLLADFYHAAEVGAKFQHANIVAVYDVGRNTPLIADQIDNMSHYLVMEYVPGVNLKQFMLQYPRLSVEESLKIIFECCKALDYIHFHGIAHRDIKPGNIIINPETLTVKITDFSISENAYSELNKHMGTLPYMTPEHFLLDRRLTRQTDIFALGSVMYHLLTGKCPFHGDSVDDVVKNIVYSRPEPIRNLNPEVPPQVEFIVIKAMNKLPEERFQSALEFTDAVNMALHTIAASDGGEKLSRMDSESIEEYLLLRGNSWFRDFSPGEIEELIRLGEVLSFDAGDYVFKQGEEALSFYTLLEGEADVVKDAKVISKLNTGECFGEIGYLTHEQKRTASIRAATHVRVLSVNSESISSLSSRSQASFYKAFLTMTIERLVKSNSQNSSR